LGASAKWDSATSSARIGVFTEDVKEWPGGYIAADSASQRDSALRRPVVRGGNLHLDRLGLIGLGAIGGSVAGAASRAGVGRVVGFALGDDGAQALQAGAVTATAPSAAAVVAESDLVVLAAPPGENLRLLGELAGLVEQYRVVLTDVTSVQAPMLQRASEAGIASRMVASHPFCGTHESGFAGARPDLLEGAVVYVSGGAAAGDVVQQVMEFWRTVRASPTVVEPAWHDEVVAWTSHLPQAVSTVLGATLGSDAPHGSTFGSGALETTRLAASSVQMWQDLLLLNRVQVLRAVDAFQGHLALLRDAVQQGDADGIGEWLERGAAFRRQF
jgi:prephenate dehydrogenase